MKIKKLPSSFINFTNVSGPTLSLKPGELGIPGRKNGANAIADLMSADRLYFSREWIDEDNFGDTVLKSDKFRIIDDKFYQEVKKKNNPHHHIKGQKATDDRLSSIINQQEVNEQKK